MIQYTQDNYLGYIKNNRVDLVDKLLEAMPDSVVYRANMLADLDSAIDLIDSGQYPTINTEKIVFDHVLAISMNRLGVK